MKEATLCLLIKNDELLLGMKKQGLFGEGKWNGYGGKREPGETWEAATRREVKEESGLDVKRLKKVAEIEFYFTNPPPGKVWDKRVCVSIATEWDGELVESDEMTHQPFNIRELPYDQMWSGDRLWMPLVLQNRKVKGRITFDMDNSSVKSYEIRYVTGFRDSF